MRTRAVRWGLMGLVIAALSACGGGETVSAPNSQAISSWSAQPVKVGPFATASGDQVAGPYTATPLPRLNSVRDGWFNTGAPGQATGIRYAPQAEVIISESGQLRALPSPPHLDMGRDIYNMFTNLRGEILLDTASGLALWTDARWLALPTPTLGAGETLSSTKAIALNNAGQVLLELSIRGADTLLRSRAMLITAGQVKYLEGRPTALSDAGHIAVQEERLGTLQASVYLPHGEYLMGGRIPWGSNSYLPEVQTIMTDGTVLGVVYIPGLGRTEASGSQTASLIGKSLFRAGLTSLELWPRGAAFDTTHYIDYFQGYRPFNRQGQVALAALLAPFASSTSNDRGLGLLAINEQLFDLNALLSPSPSNPSQAIRPVWGFGDSGELIHVEGGENNTVNSWLIQPAPRSQSVKP